MKFLLLWRILKSVIGKVSLLNCHASKTAREIQNCSEKSFGNVVMAKVDAIIEENLPFVSLGDLSR